MMLHVRVFAPDGSRHLSAKGAVDGGDPAEAGRKVARELAGLGARELIHAADEFALRHGFGKAEA
jgi:hypothetical protein